MWEGSQEKEVQGREHAPALPQWEGTPDQPTRRALHTHTHTHTHTEQALNRCRWRTFLVVPWLRLQAPKAGDPAPSLVRELDI